MECRYTAEKDLLAIAFWRAVGFADYCITMERASGG